MRETMNCFKDAEQKSFCKVQDNFVLFEIYLYVIEQRLFERRDG